MPPLYVAVRQAALVLSLLCCWQFADPRLAHADDVADEADVQFVLGTQQYQAGEYKRALSHFLASNRLARNRNVLFNIARCYEQLGQFPEAHRYYTRALEGETEANTAASLKQAIARIAPRVALLHIESNPPGARIYLDRKDLGERGSAPQSMALPPATYRVIATLEGFEEAVSAPVSVRLGGEQHVKFDLVRIVGTIKVPGPAGGEVRLDAENSPESCIAPCELEAAPGQHTVLYSRAGFRTAQLPVLVRANQVAIVQPEAIPETGSLVVNADEPDATIEIDGLAQGFTPALLTVATGPHRVRVTLRGFKPLERDVEIKANQQVRLDLRLASIDSVEAASRIEQPIGEAPASVSIIRSQELRAMRYPTVAQALRGTRGVYLSDDRGYTELGFRGLGSPGSYGNRVLVTLDGVPLNDDWVWASYVGFDLRSDLEDIDRIEVVRGPGSVVYGTSAFSGVVNLVTRTRDVPTGREVGVSAVGEGVGRARVRVTQRLGKDSGVWASVSGGRSEGRDFFFPEFQADGPPEVAGVARGIDGSRFANLTGKAWSEDITLTWSLNHHDKHLPTAQFETLFGDSRTRQADTRAVLDARWEPKFGKTASSLTRVHANAYSYRGTFAYSPEDGGLCTTRYDSDWYGAEQRFVVTPSSTLSASLGAEGQIHPRAHQSGESELDGVYLDDQQDFVLGALYGSLDVEPSAGLRLSAGGRLDYYSTFGASFNPRFALIAEPYAGGNLKLLLGKAFKAPSVYELFYTAFGQISSPDLQPENIYSAEIEMNHQFSPTVMLTGSVFANYLTDLITLEELPPEPDGSEVIQFQNTDTPVGTVGAELELRREWKEGWMASASYSLQQSVYLASTSLSDFVSLARSDELREVPNSPRHLASLKGAVPILSRALVLVNRLSFEGGRYDVDDIADSDTEQTRTRDALLWDLVLSGTEARYGLEYSLGVYNAFDSRAQSPVSNEFRQRSIPIAGRSLLASGTVSF